MVAKKTTAIKPVKKTVAQATKSAVLARLLEPSTWAGLLTIGTVVATGGVATWLNPSTLPVLLTGVGLVLSKDGTPLVKEGD